MANKIQEAFNHIHADSLLKESTKQYLSDKRRRRIHFHYSPAVYRILATACIILFLTVGIGGYSWIQTPVSYVSIDVNPSIELALNRLNRVVSVTAYNKEGKEILNELSLKGKPYTEAIDTIMESEIMSKYLTDESELVFTVAADQSRNSKLTAGIQDCSCQAKHSSQSISTDLEIVSEAHANGLSVGKYYAYLQLIQYDNSISVDDCRHMDMAEIHGLIREHEQNENHIQEEEHGHNRNQNNSQNNNRNNGN